ncbi:SipW-dependent-type signal peptide-containing protein [Eubacteriales bacterium OttesenSCG-928-K08]|nr:SipW-dependent-type signal peptide-containing protein [Eubacteriales bacterium OttesenSCG-928-K08]
MNKKKLRIALAISLVAVLIVGATWAYLSDVTQKKKNVFTFSSGLTAELYEPEWDGEDENGQTTPADNPDLGKNKADDILPGAVLPKNPYIINTCNVDEFVAMKVTFRHAKDGFELTEDQMELLNQMMSLDIDSTNWFLYKGGENSPIFYYMYRGTPTGTANGLQPGTLQPGLKTHELFTEVTFDIGIDNDEMNWLSGLGTLELGGKDIPGLREGLEIYIEGAAVQASAFPEGFIDDITDFPNNYDTNGLMSDLEDLLRSAPYFP